MENDVLRALFCDSKTGEIKKPDNSKVVMEKKSNFFPMLRKIVTESKKIPSTDRSCDIYHFIW